jgi:predicted TIM-barrel fold metal-dependent hydrolase
MRKYQVISGDGHVEVPADRWSSYVPEQHRHLMPKLISKENGDYWQLAEFELENHGNLVCDLPYDEIVEGCWRYYNPDGTSRAGTGSAVQRLNEQDRDGTDAEILFPPVHGPKFLRRIAGKDREAYLANVRAYNTWLAEEYCATAPDRLIGNAIVPETGIEDAIEEMRRCKELGLRGVCLLMWPNGEATRAPGDDRYFAASQDLDIRIAPHGALGMGQAEDSRNFAFKGAALLGANVGGPANSVIQLIMSGILDQYPNLKFYFAETNAGWIPHAMNMADEFYQRWYKYYDAELPRMPSEYFKEHFIFNFIDDRLAMPFRHYIGVDMLTWGTDFPHSVGTFPHSREIIEDIFEGVPAEDRRKVLVENACGFYGLDPESEITPTPTLASVQS